MSGTTPNFALPYPEGSDPPDGATQIRALAEAVEYELGGLRADGSVLVAWWSGAVTYTFTNGTLDANWGALPAPGWVWVAPPILVCHLRSNDPPATPTVFTVGSVTTSGFRIHANRVTGAAVNGSVPMFLGATGYARREPSP